MAEQKNLVKGCIYLEPANEYRKAKELLQKRFGDPLRVLAAYQQELRRWKPIMSFDAVSLQKLCTFLVKTSNIATEHFNSFQILCTVVSKLPGNLRDRWNRCVYGFRTNEKREHKLTDLIDFIERETVLETDPLFSKEAMNETLGLSSQDARKSKIRSFLANFRCLYCDRITISTSASRLKLLSLKKEEGGFSKIVFVFGAIAKGTMVETVTSQGFVTFVNPSTRHFMVTNQRKTHLQANDQCKLLLLLLQKALTKLILLRLIVILSRVLTLMSLQMTLLACV